MKLSRILPLVVGGAVAGIVVSSASPAQGLDFTFSFTGGSSSNVPGSVTGIIYGLTDNTSGQAASDLQITSYPSGIVGYPAAPFSILSSSLGTVQTNTFSVFGGSITSANFLWFGGGGVSYRFELNNQTYNGIRSGTLNKYTFNTQGLAGATYTSATPVPFDIPGGATIPTVGSLLALGAMRQAKKRLAAKTLVVNPVETVV